MRRRAFSQSPSDGSAAASSSPFFAMAHGRCIADFATVEGGESMSMDKIIKNIAKGIARIDQQKIREEIRIPLERRMRDAFSYHSQGWYDEKATRIIIAARIFAKARKYAAAEIKGE